MKSDDAYCLATVTFRYANAVVNRVSIADKMSLGQTLQQWMSYGDDQASAATVSLTINKDTFTGSD